MPTLLDISADMQALDDLLDEVGGDVTDEQVAAYIDELFAETGDAFDGKVDNYCAVIRQRDLLAAACKAEEERIAMRRRAHENAAKRLKERLMLVLALRGMAKAGRVRTASINNNGGRIPLDMRADITPTALPEKFQRITVSVDTDAVRAALEAGEVLEFASLGERGKHLRIR